MGVPAFRMTILNVLPPSLQLSLKLGLRLVTRCSRRHHAHA
jgi:hypothetical protein